MLSYADEAEMRFYADAHREWRSAPTARPSQRGGVQICPICGYRGGAFAMFGLSRRRNAQCPRCGSVERHRYLWTFLEQSTNFFKRPQRVLHCAAEPCLVDAFRRQHGRRYVTVDKFDPTSDCCADLTDLPFSAASFDIAVSSHVLEHIPDDRAAMRELGRVVRPGGWAVIMVPFDAGTPTNDMPDSTPALRLAVNGHPYHYRTYGPDVVDRLAAVGFDVATYQTRDVLSRHRQRRHRINANTLFFCRRRPDEG